MKLAEAVNSWSDEHAKKQFSNCCSSTKWIEQMTERRPFRDDAHVQRTALAVWLNLEKEDWLEAFQGHPKIGDVDSLKKKYAGTAQWAKGEQSGVDGASDDVLEELKRMNDAYEKKFGYIFIVCATGKAARAMLDDLKTRYTNEPDSEIEIAVKEQAKITALRLEKLV